MKQHKHHFAENISLFAATESGDIFMFNSPTGEFHLGAAAIMPPITGTDAALIQMLNTTLGDSNFPPGTVVQFSQISNADVDGILETYLSGKLGVSKILTQLCTEQVKLYESAKSVPLIEGSGALINKKRVFIGIKFPVKSHTPSDDVFKDINTDINSFFDNLHSANLPFTRLDQLGLRQLILTVHNPWVREAGSVPAWDTELPLKNQILPIASSVEYANDRKKRLIKFNDGEYFARIMSVNFLPENAAPWLMDKMVGDPKGLHNQIAEPFYLSVNILYKDQEAAKAEQVLRTKLIDNQSSPAIMKLIPEVATKKKRINVLKNTIAETGSPIVDMNLTMVLYSKKERSLEQATNKLQAYFSTVGGRGKKFDMRVDSRILRTLFEQSLPLNATANGLKKTYRIKTMAVTHAVRFLPIYGDYVYPVTPSGSLFTTRRSQLSNIDIFASNTNYNGMIFAESGAGKSVLVQGLILDHLAAGGRAWVIDDGRSFEKMAKVIGGQVINFSPTSDICLNPFTTIYPGELNEELDLLKTLFTKMAAPNDGLTDKELPLLERAIMQAYENNSTNASVVTVADALTQSDDPAARSIGDQLHSFARGQFAKWFNGKSNINFNSNLVVLEISDLKALPTLKSVVTLQLFAAIARDIRSTKTNQKKLLVIEEAKQHLYDPIMAKGIEETYARARKDAGAAVCVTQSLLDIDESPRGTSIMGNTNWQMILRQRPESIKKSIERGALEIDQYGAHLLETVHTVPGKYSEFMFKRDKAFSVYRAIYPRFTQILLSTKGAERTEILNAIENGADPVDAINSFMAREQQSQSQTANY